LAELTRDLALKQARRADRVLSKGGFAWPLLGVPYGAKDLLATAGIPTRWGSPPHRSQVFDFDAPVISKLADRGAVMIAKLAMVEIAGGGGYEYASASLHGPGLNPWNLNHWAGGSSSGSGSAVAAGLVPYALGSETWGSIVTPSAYCGITGLRPTWGLVSRHGAMELAWSMDKVGPMARSAEDCGWVLQAIAGPDSNDPTTVQSGFVFRSRISRGALRLGILAADFSDIPELEHAFDDALRVLRKAGVKFHRLDLPDHPYEETARTLLNGEMASAHAEFIKSEQFDDLVDAGQKDGLRKSLELRASEYVRALQRRLQITRDVLSCFDRVDALVSPTLMTEATTLTTNLKTAFRRRGGYSVLGALCGVPALTVPMGFGPLGLPLGLCFTGDRFAENTLLQLGMAYQRETDWHERHPSVNAS
jgi:aspartyl-tRNA(Asn)/glutamyl-tRNA(Gln) amidotransferase subunit A